MTTKVQALTIITLGATLMAAPAQTTQTTAAAPAPPPPALSSTEQTIKDIKNPLSWMNWGADLRLRNEYFDNLLTLSPKNPIHEQDYFRFRGRVWASVTPVDDLSLNIRLATEAREWMREAGYSPMKISGTQGKVGPDYTEGVIDNLNVAWKNAAGLPATIKVGRQDLFLGDGWLVGDGTPYDGSWTYFLDSARFTYELKDQHTAIDVIGIMQEARDDAWLYPIGAEQNRYLTEQNEKGAILSIGNTSLKAANLTGYFIYKHDDKVNDPGASASLRRTSDNADIFTIGGRVTGTLSDNWKYSAEGAYQFGEKQDAAVQFPAPVVPTDYRTINAFGFNSKLTYMVKDKLNNQLGLSFEYLSGDNPNTRGDEMFDVLWGRWPRWSEIGLYSYAAETRIGQEANLIRFGPTWTVNPIKDMEFSASYYALFAPEATATREASTTLFTGDGNFRGHFVSGVLKYKFSRHMTGHLWSEFQFPGDYYASKTMISFLRAEVMFTF
jgi:hypothetical protein